MGWEIERRYLIRVLPQAWQRFGEGRHLRQGYVATGAQTVRIRSGEGRGDVLTCKSGAGILRREVECVVPETMTEALFEAAGSRVIEKVRHTVGPWEVDRFLGSLDGLEILEIELAEPDAPVPRAPEGIVILREVTDANTFTSSMLAELSDKERENWVRRAYAEVGT
jgi:CYTH domain-containing protein